MDPPIVPAAKLQKRINSLLSSTADLGRDLLNHPASSVSLDSRVQDMRKLAQQCATARIHAGATRTNLDGLEKLDELGTRLWNHATKQERDSGEVEGRMLNVRLLAFYVIECAQGATKRSYSNIVRILTIGLKTVRRCLDRNELAAAKGVLERVAIHHGVLVELVKERGGGEDDSAELSRLACWFFTLRMRDSWMQKNSMLEMMYQKAAAEPAARRDVQTGEELARALAGIGGDMLREKTYPLAIQWLQRAFGVLGSAEVMNLSDMGSELRMQTAHKLAISCMASGLPEDLEKAETIVEIMLEDWPGLLAVLALKLRLVLLRTPDDVDGYARILFKMIDVAHLTDSNFALVVGKIRSMVVKKNAVKQACECLDALIRSRLLPMERDDLLEKAFVTRIWATIQDRTCGDNKVVENLKVLLDVVAKQLKRPLGQKVTGSATGLLWKASEVFYMQHNYHASSKWCRLALHVVFDKSGELNIAKISRRIILCCIQTKEYGVAAEVYNSMPASTKDAALSRYLMFKVAMRTSDDDLALTCLTVISSDQDADQKFLYGCAIDARSSGNAKFALKPLQVVLEQMDRVPEVKQPILLRCTIRLTMGELESLKDPKVGAESLCGLYERALKYARRSGARQGAVRVFDANELDWFARNGYNLGLRGIIEWTPAMALRILMATFGFLELYPEETPDILNRTMMCAFLCASICFEIARREETTEGQLQHYLFTRNYVEHYRKRLAMAGENTDARERFVKLIVYDFESAAKLKNWDALEKLVDEAKDVPSSDTVEVFGKMGDLVGCAMAPERIVKMVWKRIVDHQMTLQEQVGLRTMSAWIRMVVQFSLKRDPDDVEEAFGQALELTRGAREDSPYPDEELQWLTATAWNKAIDCSCMADADNQKRFSDLAFSMAGVSRDKTMLRFLQNKVDGRG